MNIVLIFLLHLTDPFPIHVAEEAHHYLIPKRVLGEKLGAKAKAIMARYLPHVEK